MTKRKRPRRPPVNLLKELGIDGTDALGFLNAIPGRLPPIPALAAPAPIDIDTEIDEEDLGAEIVDELSEDYAPQVEWSSMLAVIINQVSRSDQARASKLRAEFTNYRSFTANGTVVDDRGRRNAVAIFIDCEGRSYCCECSCSVDHCVHLVSFAMTLREIVDGPSSPLRETILGSAEYHAISQAEETLSELDVLLANLQHNQSPQPKVENTSVPTRLSWNVNSERERLVLEAREQRQKKRGSGWTKGKTISISRLHSHRNDFIRNDVDARIIDTIRTVNTGYYYGSKELEFDKFDALTALVGHDNVMLNGMTAQVKRIEFGILATPSQDGTVELKLISDDEGPATFFKLEKGLAMVSEKKSTIAICSCTPAQIQFATSLIAEGAKIPAARIPQLKERLQAIGNFCNVQMPAEMAGRIVKEKTKSVVHLLSRGDGTLDCSLRVQDACKRLNRPGGGILVYADTIKGKPVQRKRDGSREIQQAQDLSRRLGLRLARKTSEWDWRFLDFEDTIQFLSTIEETSKQLDFQVQWSEESEQPIRVVGAVTPKSVRVQISRKKDWFDIEGGFTFGDETLQLSDLLMALDSEPIPGYAEIHPGTWAQISNDLRKRLKRLRDATHKNRSSLQMDATAAIVMQDLVESQIDLNASSEWMDCVAKLESSKKIRPKPSADFKAELRDYQCEGYRWMRRLAEWGVGACLADDMGLGKTVQTLCVLVDRAKLGPTLVIAPTSVGFNWQRETERFAPTLKPHLYRETSRSGFIKDVGEGDVVICSYGLALRDAEVLSTVHWGTLVLDEAQFIKNSKAKTAQAIRTFQADWKLALTGTPMENHLGELWSIFRAISPGLFGSWESFRKQFAGPIEKENDPDRRRALSQRIQPFVLRRTKKEVLTELPERTESNLYVDLTAEERQQYDKMRLAAVGELDQIVGLPEANDQRFRILAILTRLRQMACHIGLVDESWEGASAKLEVLAEKIRELRDEGHQVLIFSQFTKYLALIRRTLEDANVSFEYLDGSTPAKTRQERVDRFQEGNTDAFLISLKAGGTGLNLTAADYVIHMDPWWNPAVEDQATDRAHRIGQDRPVIVYRIVARDTIEEKILSLHADKRDLVSGVMEGTQKAAALTTSQLADMIRNPDD